MSLLELNLFFVLLRNELHTSKGIGELVKAQATIQAPDAAVQNMDEESVVLTTTATFPQITLPDSHMDG